MEDGREGIGPVFGFHELPGGALHTVVDLAEIGVDYPCIIEIILPGNTCLAIGVNTGDDLPLLVAACRGVFDDEGENELAIIGVSDEAQELRVQHHEARIEHLPLWGNELDEGVAAHAAIDTRLGEQRHLVIIVAPQAIEEVLYRRWLRRWLLDWLTRNGRRYCRLVLVILRLVAGFNLEDFTEEERDAFIHDGRATIALHVIVGLVFADFERILKVTSIRFPRFLHHALAVKIGLRRGRLREGEAGLWGLRARCGGNHLSPLSANNF